MSQILRTEVKRDLLRCLEKLNKALRKKDGDPKIMLAALKSLSAQTENIVFTDQSAAWERVIQILEAHGLNNAYLMRNMESGLQNVGGKVVIGTYVTVRVFIPEEEES